MSIVGTPVTCSPAPCASVITPTLLRTHSRISDATSSGVDDSYLQLLINAATTAAEEAMQTTLLPRALTKTFYRECDPIILTRGPVISITSVKDSTDAAIDYSTETVGFQSRINLDVPATWPVTVTYQAGYVASDGTTPNVPADITLAILTHAATLFENKESVTDKTKTPMPHGLEMFYCARRRDTGAA